MAKKGKPSQLAREISEQTALEMGVEHLETAFEKKAAGMYLRITLDKPGGITLNDCEAFHRAVQPRLENIDYDYLEVCSAGIDRPIRTPEDARKAKGKEVEIRLYKPLDGRKEYLGILEELNGEAYVISTAQGMVSLPVGNVALARRTVDLSVLEETANQQEER